MDGSTHPRSSVAPVQAFTDGAGFRAYTFDTSSPEGRAALHKALSFTPEEKARQRRRCLSRELLSLCAQFGIEHGLARTVPADAPAWAARRHAELSAELGAASKARAA